MYMNVEKYSYLFRWSFFYVGGRVCPQLFVYCIECICTLCSLYVTGKVSGCNIMAEEFRFICLAFGFSWAENLSAQCIG